MEGLGQFQKFVYGIQCLGCLLLLAGCSPAGRAQIYCWSPPVIHETAGKTVVLARIIGPKADAEALQAAFVAKRPDDGTPVPRLLAQADLQRYSTLQLVSATDSEPSDMALAHASRQQNVDYLLTGEVMQRRGAPAGEQSLTVSWRLLDIRANRQLGGAPITITPKLLDEEYPQLAARTDRQQALAEAVAMESWQLLTAHIQPFQVELAKSSFTAGTKAILAGNRYAELGNWRAAEQIWDDVHLRHPHQHAALHNLALAAAARQDFAAAKSLAQQALQQHDSDRYRRTIVWIEARQMELTKAFDLPPPSEGWLFAPDESTE